jgi:Fur family ferric uptake transcriptional regulator
MPNHDGDHAWLWDQLDAYLARHGLRQTNQRKDIVKALLDMREKHVDAEKLHTSVKALGLDIGLATIYRTLGLLKEAGIVEQRSFTDGRAIFELAIPDEHHDHLICIDCGVVKEFENAEIEAIQLKIANQLGFSLSSHKLELYARCIKPTCPNRTR